MESRKQWAQGSLHGGKKILNISKHCSALQVKTQPFLADSNYDDYKEDSKLS